MLALLLDPFRTITRCRRARRVQRRLVTDLVVTLTVLLQLTSPSVAQRSPLLVDVIKYEAGTGTVVVEQRGQLTIEWPAGNGEQGQLVINLKPTQPLFDRISVKDASGTDHVLATQADPVTLLTVGSRAGRRPEAGWVVFFDKVWERPHETHSVKLTRESAAVVSRGTSTTVVLGDLNAGSFHGELQITVYRDAPLVHVESVLQTAEDRRAILYDAGLVSDNPHWSGTGWVDTTGTLREAAIDAAAAAQTLAVRHRTILTRSENGTLALFPPPHQFFYPLDQSDNLRFVWSGRKFRDLTDRFGLGVRQHFEGDRRYVPWFNAPPGTKQRMGLFYLLSPMGAEETMDRVLRFTRKDRFKKLPGFQTFTSHYHFAHTMIAMQRRAEGRDPAFTPDFVEIFKGMGIDIVHLAEFHGDGNPRDPGPRRLPQLEMMHAECRRLSDPELLILPGEEPNVHFGGHWIDFFPKPVYWIMRREESEPFAEEHPRYGTVYRVRNSDELLRLLEREGGLAWTAHPRIKSSFGFPDSHRDSNFYLSERWLGAAWKAMPADLSRPRLGKRVLDLLDDMANWGQQKYIVGEVDVFKIDTTHELYGHMNVNYLKLDHIPSFDDGWQSVLDALRQGEFFVTTGEIVIPRFTIGGVESGGSLELAQHGKTMLSAEIEWTFPLRFAEIVSGDGHTVYRERLDIDDSLPFGKRTITREVDLSGRTWVRFAVWDIAANGAFSQPVWLVP